VNRTKTIDHLDATNDPIIKMFKKGELLPVTESSLYHSPDVSETDEDASDGKRKIVTKDLEWRSSTVRLINLNDFNCSDIKLIF
jgi:hypothetical protein